MLGMVHISASSMTKRGMNTCESHQASRLGALEQNCFVNFSFLFFLCVLSDGGLHTVL